jgi:DNA-binding transcriptional MocR family regulator
MDGLQIEQGRRMMQAGKARWLYLTPTIQNPTGTSLSTVQRRMLTQYAQQTEVSIIEKKWPRGYFAGYVSFAHLGPLS